MATLPDYEQQQSIKVQPGAVPGVSGESTFQKLGQGAREMSAAWAGFQETRKALDYSERKAKYQLGLIDIQDRAFKDPNFRNSPEYKKELEKLREDTLADVGSPDVYNRLAVDTELGNALSGSKIDGQFWEKEVAHGQATTAVDIQSSYELMSMNISKDSKPEEKKIYEDQIAEYKRMAVSAGYMSDIEVEELDKKIRLAQAKKDANSKPEQFLNRGNQYYKVSPDDYIGLQNEAKQALEAIDKNAEFFNQENMYETSAMFMDELLDPERSLASRTSDERAALIDKMEKARAIGKVPEFFADAFVDFVKTPYKQPKPGEVTIKEKDEFFPFAKDFQNILRVEDKMSRLEYIANYLKKVNEMTKTKGGKDIDIDELTMTLFRVAISPNIVGNREVKGQALKTLNYYFKQEKKKAIKQVQEKYERFEDPSLATLALMGDEYAEFKKEKRAAYGEVDELARESAKDLFEKQNKAAAAFIKTFVTELDKGTSFGESRKAAIFNAFPLNSYIMSFKDKKPGDTVILPNGWEVIYSGDNEESGLMEFDFKK